MDNKKVNNINIQASEVVEYNSLFKNQQHINLREINIIDFLTKIINDKIDINNDLSILEVGFNDGSRLKKVSSFYPNAKVIGLEVRQACVDNLVKDGYDCRLVTDELFDINNIFNINEKFDVIYGYNVIHHISVPYKYLRHLFTLLKPGGILLFPHESHSTHLTGYVLNTISGNWKYEMNIFKLSKNKIINDCKNYASKYNIGYNGLLCLFGFPKLNKIYRFFRFHKLPIINDIIILIEKNIN
ncbi:MAG: class I SAM-dependent methyltransferase [Deltaproteobacteria bacterium]|jgi:2-polyprenyl-3-methyl-5-hydroxy-6-metoxy-1,4-benzoquinol methylase|nr:class I SAM-dependent methyltransferase [Deltaproteobacteria bacterium]